MSVKENKSPANWFVEDFELQQRAEVARDIIRGFERRVENIIEKIQGIGFYSNKNLSTNFSRANDSLTNIMKACPKELKNTALGGINEAASPTPTKTKLPVSEAELDSFINGMILRLEDALISIKASNRARIKKIEKSGAWQVYEDDSEPIKKDYVELIEKISPVLIQKLTQLRQFYSLNRPETK